MLYVFIVSSGMMLKFDMNLAVKKVLELKKEITVQVHIPPEEQVLLCSGGEELQSDNIVGNYYGAGTDTNPIFLFSKFPADIEPPYSSSLTSSIDMSIAHDVEDCAGMAPSVNTATVKLSLAQRFAEYAEVGRRECEELVHGQHLQQQGWAAVIANLEDAKDTLIKRKIRFEELFSRYLKNRPSYLETIYMFPKSIELLAKIPLLPKLIKQNECTAEDLNTDETLLSWFVSESQDVLETMVEKCRHLLEELDEHTITALNEDFQQVMKNVDNNDMKEIRGIGDRLSRLNGKVEEGKRCEKDQRDMSAWFNQYQEVITKDPHSIPSVCKTFQTQLEIMMENHKKLRHILDICIRAKDELSKNINTRLNVYISKVESDMYRIHMKMVLLESHVQSVMSQVESYHQVQLAPQRYLRLLAEVCRRKVFSAHFIKWARELSSHVSKMYYKELNLRKDFGSPEAKNMVDNLFPGMNDVPPPFAVECPQPFDQNLPDIEKGDLELMKTRFPELSYFCEVPPPEPMPYLCQAHECDSAFSSNVPSCRNAASNPDSALENAALTDKLVVPSVDYSSLPSEYASLPNEVFSLTSSPFEDPLLPTRMQERTKPEHVDSEIEEFVTLDHYRTSPVNITPGAMATHGTGRARPTSSSDVMDMSVHRKHRPKVSKARSDGDAVSPMQERLKSPDSLAVSADFQAAEYYIDDSLPSSYTESNATSPLMRGGRMVKSHHVVISELQRQVEEKSGALSVTKSSLENTHSNIMKLHAKISALQKYVRELQGILRTDLTNLKAHVLAEMGGRREDLSRVVDFINTSMGKVEQQMMTDKETALSELREEFSETECKLMKKLEIERQKLSDAETQINYYEEHLRAVCLSYEETKHEKEILERDLQEKQETIQRVMLENELEYDALKNSIKNTLQSHELEVNQLKQCLSETVSKVENIEKERDALQLESQNLQTLVSSLQEDKKELESQRNRLQEESLSLKKPQEIHRNLEIVIEERNQLSKELEKVKEELNRFKDEAEKLKSKELKELEDKLSLKHKSDLESLRSRFRLAVSMTSLEKSPVSSSPESCDPESLSFLEEMKNVIAESQENRESEKLQKAQAEHQKQLEALNAAANNAYLRHKEELAQVVESMQSKHKNALEDLQSRITAENQVSFNEAINILAKEKDSIIESLKSRIAVLDARQLAVKNYLSECHVAAAVSPVQHGEGAMSQSESAALSACTAVLNKDKYECFLKFKADIESILQLTDTTKLPNQSSGGNTETCESLRKKLKTKEEECNSLISKLMSASSPSVTKPPSCCANKVSIFTCEPKEIVLVNYEEKLGHYTIFHLGNYLHFLHSESLSDLDLQIPPVKSKSFFIGQVTNKEFCITKKVNNRFKLTLGTKFFRVKVSRWSRETEGARVTQSVLEQSIRPGAEPRPMVRSRSTQTVEDPPPHLLGKRRRQRSRSVVSSSSV